MSGKTVVTISTQSHHVKEKFNTSFKYFTIATFYFIKYPALYFYLKFLAPPKDSGGNF